MDIPENSREIAPGESQKEADSSAPRDAVSSHAGMDRRQFLRASGLAAGTALAGAAQAHAPRQADAMGTAAGRPVPKMEPPVTGAALAARKKTLFGIGYETWFVSGGWDSAEARPVLGYYSSLDSRVIRRHAQWLSDAGFDFILIDWSNNLGPNWTNGAAQRIIKATMLLIDEYTRLKRRPKFALLLGLDNGSCTTPQFHTQIQHIAREILSKPEYARLWQDFDNKPLLAIYTGPSFGAPPVYVNPRFTVRFMGAFHESTLNPGGAWSWIDRAPIINGSMFPVFPFDSYGFSGWKVSPNWSLTGTASTAVGRSATTAKNPRNVKGSLVSPAFKISQRVITFNATGINTFQSPNTDYHNLNALNNRNVFLLRDAETESPLRYAEPPNSGQFAMCQWDVSDLMERSVVFEAIANNVAPQDPPFGFSGLSLTRNEQLAAAVGVGGGGGPASWIDWDSQGRLSGATLVKFMTAAFRYQPDVVLIQQWNEFRVPDQYSVEGSNDIEPTVIHRLVAVHGQKWRNWSNNQCFERYKPIFGLFLHISPII